MNFKFHYILYILNSIILIFCDPTVPVLLLTNIGFNIQCPAMDHLSEERFLAILPTIPNIFILVEEKLSPEDFSSSNPLINKVNYCPHVTNNLVSSIFLKYGQKDRLNLTTNNIEIPLKYIQEWNKNIFPFISYIYFQDEDKFNTRQDMMFAHITLINQIHDILKTSSKPILVIYTGLEPSWFIRIKRESTTTEESSTDESATLTEEESTIVTTQSTSETEQTPTEVTPTNQSQSKISVIYKSNFLIYMANSMVLNITPPYFDKNNELDLGKCSDLQLLEETSQFILKCEEREIKLNYTINKLYWSIRSIYIPNRGFISPYKPEYLSFYPRAFGAPVGQSYHCSEIKLALKIPLSKKVVTLTIRPIQVQIFKEGTSERRFGISVDCAAWFTIPILMGLFISAILLIILGIGIIMMLDIRTNDRFDVPKKPLTNM